MDEADAVGYTDLGEAQVEQVERLGKPFRDAVGGDLGEGVEGLPSALIGILFFNPKQPREGGGFGRRRRRRRRGRLEEVDGALGEGEAAPEVVVGVGRDGEGKAEREVEGFLLLLEGGDRRAP